ncbi:hypothetical protein [Phenylobacterium sp.]|uniref:hypothetical protein n=1 Tax=Phenylobacterium sp. TaxID=1871053 RepID=UPI0027284396|nr:hypothetical protein [Phenylobacterium sp.]MDO8380154.1 hypothetical protein [Phenylobacterium sp.]
MEKIVVFGDESFDERAACYAIFAVTESDVVRAEEALGDAKVLSGGHVGWALHAKTEFFDEARRRRSAWSDFSWNQIYDLYWSIFVRLLPIASTRVVGFTPLVNGSLTIPGGKWTDRDGKLAPIAPQGDLTLDGASVAMKCVQAALAPLVERHGSHCLTFRPDPTSTMLPWYGNRRSQKAAIDGMWFDVGRGAERLEVEIVKGTKPPLLEVADALAFIARKTANRSHSNTGHRFDLLHALTNPEMVRLAIGS